MAPGENFGKSHDDNPSPKFRLNGSKREVVFMELLLRTRLFLYDFISFSLCRREGFTPAY